MGQRSAAALFHEHVAAQRAIQQIAHPVDLTAQVDRLRLERLAPRKSEQLTAERGPPIGGLPHLSNDALATFRFRRAFQQAQAARNDHEKVIEIVGDAAGQLTERIDFLRLAQMGLGLRQARLIAQPLGDVMDELERADQVTAAVSQRVEFHFVVPAAQARVPKFVRRREFLARERAPPIVANVLPFFRKAFEGLQQVIAHRRAETIDSVQLVRGGAVDRHDVEIPVKNQHLRVRRLHDVDEYLALGEHFGHAPFQFLIQFTKLLISGFARGDVDGCADDAYAAVALEQGSPLGRYPADEPIFLADGPIFDVI